jgi:hypothetical protein
MHVDLVRRRIDRRHYATILTGTSQVETSDSHSVLVIRNSVATLRFRN